MCVDFDFDIDVDIDFNIDLDLDFDFDVWDDCVVLDERTDELWDTFDDTEDLDDLNMANSFEIASRQANADAKQFDLVLQKL